MRKIDEVASQLIENTPAGYEINTKCLYPIAKRLIQSDGVCPCHHSEWTEETPHEDKICPCKTFRDTGECHCGLYCKKGKPFC